LPLEELTDVQADELEARFSEIRREAHV